MKNFMIALLIQFLLSGCTTSNSYTPISTVENPPKQSHFEQKSRITIVRNRNDAKIPIITAIAIDDWVVASLGPGERTTLEVKPGLRYIGIKGKNTPMMIKPAREYFFYIELNKEGSTYELHSVLESQSKKLHNS